MPEHKQVRVKVGNYDELIDDGIADLIREIWGAGLDTVNSCQDNVPEGYVWVQFAFTHDAEAFLNIVTRGSRSSFYDRVTGSAEKDQWIFHAMPEDMNLEGWNEEGEWHEKRVGPPDFIFSVSVRFPHRDLKAVVKKLVRYNKSRWG